MANIERVRRAAEEILGAIPDLVIARSASAVTVSVGQSVWVRVTPMGERSLIRSRDELEVHPGRIPGLRRATASEGWQAWSAIDDSCLRRLLAIIGVPLGHRAGRASSKRRLLELLSGNGAFRERRPTELEFWQEAREWLVGHERGTAALPWADLFVTVLATGGRLTRRELATAHRLAVALEGVGFAPPTTDLPPVKRRTKAVLVQNQSEPPRPRGRRPPRTVSGRTGASIITLQGSVGRVGSLRRDCGGRARLGPADVFGTARI